MHDLYSEGSMVTQGKFFLKGHLILPKLSLFSFLRISFDTKKLL